jgi:ubiquitin carboxyl-terminal hydrolase 36/42
MKLSEDSVLDSKAYLLFYVKQGSSPWFSSLLDEKDNLLSGYLQELTEKGLNEDGVPIDSDKGSYSGSGNDSDEQDSAEYSPGGPAARNEAGPSLVDMSQGNANGSMNIPDKNEASSSLGGGLSGETQKPTSSPRSSLENGNACGLALLLKNNENVSPQGSHGDKEMSHSAHGSPSQVNCAGSQGSKHHEENRSLLQSSSHKHEDGCCPENLTLRSKFVISLLTENLKFAHTRLPHQS